MKHELKPVFDDTALQVPQAFIGHLEQLTAEEETTKHNGILAQLLESFEPLDFQLLAFPHMEKLKAQLEELDRKLKNPDGSINNDQSLDVERVLWKDTKKELDRCKPNQKHFVVLSVKNVIEVAESNRWGLCKNHDFIYLYNGAYWSEIDKEAFQKFLGDAAARMNVDRFDAWHFAFREKLFKQFLSFAYLPAPEPPEDAVFINLQNGTFEISKQGTQIRPFNRSDFLTYQLPFEYAPEATAPLFQKFLDRVLPDPQKQAVLAEYLGYIFLQPSTLKLEKALLLYGTGANGKSVIFEIMYALLGKENISSIPLEQLTDVNGYYRATIANKLLNYASEINGKLDTAIFKQLVSGEPTSARLPYGNPFTITKYAKLAFNCNELPREVEHTNAYFRRFLILHFDVTIPEAEQDRQLPQKIIKHELSGVFNWVLVGLKRLLEQKGFTDCEAVRLARQEYEKQSDSVSMFVDENNYQSDPDTYKYLKDLYQEYKIFCGEDGYRPVGNHKFKERLERGGIFVKRANVGNVVYVSRAGVSF